MEFTNDDRQHIVELADSYHMQMMQANPHMEHSVAVAYNKAEAFVREGKKRGHILPAAVTPPQNVGAEELTI